MKIRFIEPSRWIGDGKLLKVRSLFIPPITLPLLAALTPADFEVDMVSEPFDDINFDDKVDLVGITAYTSRALRAYEIADEFRKRRVYVIMGGIHVSMEPEEALEHSDTVVVGEAEETWPRFLHDLRNGKPRRLYKADKLPTLENLPVPRFSLMDINRYVFCRKKGFSRFLPAPVYPVQTARGCPHGCEYCSVSVFSGRQYRVRPVEEVVNELKFLKIRGCIFIDDNIFANPSRARELFRAIRPLELIWAGQGTLSAASDRELLRLARESGCVALFLGIESVSGKALESVGRNVNKVLDYEKDIKVFKEEGISIMASMIFGLDGESPTTFQETYHFLMKNRLAYTLWHPLVPFPGTVLYKRLREVKRLKEDKWWLNRDSVNNFLVLKFTSANIAEDKFREDFLRYYRLFYSLNGLIRRILFPLQERPLLKILLNFLLKARIANDASIIES